ncbi:MAG TPA: hypothetical protein VLU47_11585, partial [Blastocatellia bacterium]|nr:hypothetical protein [Blastocatellia bacterium]
MVSVVDEHHADLALSGYQRHPYRRGYPFSVNNSVSDFSEQLLKLDTAVRGRQGDSLPFKDWRFESKDLGRNRFREILLSHSEV